jgi:hypothetical protein
MLGFSCDGLPAVASIIGVNTLRLTFASNPVADMIAVGLTPSNDGYTRIPGGGGTGLFVTAATNIGASTPLTARVRSLDPATPLTVTICETNPSDGQCKVTPAPTVTRTINQNESTYWSAFLNTPSDIVQDPAKNRIFFEFVDSSGVVRGSTSTAVTTH